MDIFSSVSSNLLVATLLSIFAWCIGRLTVRPQVRQILWMMVLLKLVSPGKCRWNPPLNQREFAFDLPPGTKVHNELLDADIVVGR